MSTADASTASMPPPDGDDDAWGHVASVFNPPKHRFGRGGRDRGPPIEVSPSADALTVPTGPETAKTATERPPRSQAIHRPRPPAAAAAPGPSSAGGPPGGDRQHAPVDEALSFKFKLSPSRDYIGGCGTDLCLSASVDDASIARYLLGSSGDSPRASFALDAGGSSMAALTFDHSPGPATTPAAAAHPFPTPSDLGRSGTFGSEYNSPDPAGGAGYPLPRMSPLVAGKRATPEIISKTSSDPIATAAPPAARPRRASPTQHLSPGQTIYNVASKSVGSPESPYFHPLSWDGQQHGNQPPTGTGEAPAASANKPTRKPSSPAKRLRQAVSNESSTPTADGAGAATVHRPTPDSRSIAGRSDGGSSHRLPAAPSRDDEWTDSLHMAPIPPFVGRDGPPVMPSTSAPAVGSWDHGGTPSPGYGYRYPQHHAHHAQHPLTPLPYHQHHSYYPDHPASSDPRLGRGYQHPPPRPHPRLAPSRDEEEERTWRKHHHLLHQFLLQFGHCDVPPGYGVGTHYATLHGWIAEQRVERARMRDGGRPSTMTPAREAALSAMGLAWDADDDGPPGAPPPMPPSSSSHSSSGRRPPKSSDRLRGGGGGPAPRVEAEHDTKTWEERFAELRDFRDETGHANIPKSYGPNPGLGRWAAEQRGQYKRMSRGQSSTLTPGRADRLARLGFKWSAREGSTGSWENWLIELRRYRSEHGNVDVPLKYPGNPALGAFVNRQRTEYRKLCQGLQTSLTEERTKDLNALGFKWAIRVSRTPWDTRLEELRRFKEEHGHCNVPSTYPQNQPLAYWVFKQRGQYRIYRRKDRLMPGEKAQMCHMTPQRIAKLEACGFDWSPPRRTGR